jgi:adenylate cyclase
MPPGFELEQGIGLRALFAMRGPRTPPQDVIVVAIDQASAQELGLPSKPSLWPRRLHAELVARLAAADAKMIAFDLFFEAPSSDENGDQALAAAMRRANNVLLVAASTERGTSAPQAHGQAGGGHVLETVVPPMPAFADAAVAHAPFRLPKATRVDAYWTFKYGAGDIPSLPAMALQVYAMECYSQLLRLWQQADPIIAAQLPDDAAAAMSRRAVPELMQVQRDALSGDSEGARRRLSVLNNAARYRPDEREACDILKAVVDLYAGEGARFLNFYGPPRTITTISYAAALQRLRSALPGKTGIPDFAGKAVFIGFSPAMAAEQDRIRDDYRTVYSGSDGLDLSGVEIAATAFANLLQVRSVRPLNGLGCFFLVLSWGLAIGMVSRNVRISFAAILAVFAGGIYLAAARYAFGEAGLWLPLVIPLCVQPPLALFAGVVLRYRDAHWERERIKRIFSQYLPGAVVEQLTSHIGPPTEINRVEFGVCLSTDAQQYTALAESMDPAQLALILNAYYRELFEAVQRNGGRVADVIGDAMLAIWAGSASESSMRTLACQAALDIVEAASGPGRDGKRPGIPTRIGIHCGNILLGNIGAGERFEFRAVGDVVNTAARIEGLGKHLGARLLVSQDVVEGVDAFLSRPLGSFLLAGKHNPVRVAELRGLRADASEHEIWLCRRFAAAVAHYENRLWRDAANVLSEILVAVPQDGPARFYLDRCEQLARHPPADPWDPLIRIEVK